MASGLTLPRYATVTRGMRPPGKVKCNPKKDRSVERISVLLGCDFSIYLGEPWLDTLLL